MIMDFDQKDLQETLVRLAGKELNQVSGEVSVRTNSQLSLVKKSISEFNHIISNITEVNKDIESIDQNMNTVAQFTSLNSNQLNIVNDKMKTLEQVNLEKALRSLQVK